MVSKAVDKIFQHVDELHNIIVEIVAERMRQDELVRIGKFTWNCSKAGILNQDKLAVLAEEFGEVAKEVTEQIIETCKYIKESLHYPNHRKLARLNALKKELVQVAAVCVAWIESLSDQISQLEAELACGRD